MTAQAQQQFEGGYYMLPQPLIRTGVHQHTVAVDRPISNATLEALNLVQATPWAINREVYNVMVAAYQSGMEIGDLPYHDNRPIPSKTDEEWREMSDEAKADWKKGLSEIHAENAKLMSRRKAFASKLRVARLMLDRAAIWFPHFLDFRGRLYPMTADLHPQGDDIGKSLLRFANGKRLGARGLFWLQVQVANCAGQDKLSLDDRVQWVQDNLASIIDSAINPLDGNRFWETAESPFQFLAACIELEAATRLDCPEDYVSYLPVNMDGSCNGLQHLSAMGRDTAGAIATNVAANVKRQDIYTEVRDKVESYLMEEARNGDMMALEWLAKGVTRKTVKRAVMTTPYGVTARGISDQLIKDKQVDGMSKKNLAAVYLRELILRAVSQTVVSAKQIMSWIQDMANALGEVGVPFTFQTPTGNIIQQSYYSLNQRRVKTLHGHLVLWEENPLGGLDVRKQVLAAAPNVIHAFDASHLVMTVIALARKVPDVSFAMIHDSFGCHACDVDALNTTLREQFVALYSENWLENVFQFATKDAPEGAFVPHWKDYVDVGTFNVAECLDSPFFFS